MMKELNFGLNCAFKGAYKVSKSPVINNTFKHPAWFQRSKSDLLLKKFRKKIVSFLCLSFLLQVVILPNRMTRWASPQRSVNITHMFSWLRPTRACAWILAAAVKFAFVPEWVTSLELFVWYDSRWLAEGPSPTPILKTGDVQGAESAPSCRNDQRPCGRKLVLHTGECVRSSVSICSLKYSWQGCSILVVCLQS